MKLIIKKNYEEMSLEGAKIIADLIKNNDECVLGLATGSTPIGMYKCLIEMNKNNEVDFSKVKTVNLDEYKGLDGNHEQSYRFFMNKNLFNHINVNKENTYVPNGKAEDAEKECENYDKVIKDLGGIDLQVLGIGQNGHIGFNEPSKELDVKTHVTGLTENTINANARFFDDINDVPKKALTMGLGGIMSAKKIILLANGKNKAEAMAKVFSGKITTDIPASVLQLHSNVVVIVDEEAASLLK